MRKACTCREKTALYNDLGAIRCQYCMGAVSEKRRAEYVAAQTPEMQRALKRRKHGDAGYCPWCDEYENPEAERQR